VCGEPGEEDGVGDAGLAPDVHDRKLARAQEPGKRLWTDAQPPLCFGEGNQLRRRGDLQGEVMLPRRWASARAEASGRRWHCRGFPSQAQGVRRDDERHITDPSGLGRHRGDSTVDSC
jgi:hypothetical protein